MFPIPNQTALLQVPEFLYEEFNPSHPEDKTQYIQKKRFTAESGVISWTM